MSARLKAETVGVGMAMTECTKEQTQASEERILKGFEVLGLADPLSRGLFVGGPVPAPGLFQVRIGNTSQPLGR